MVKKTGRPPKGYTSQQWEKDFSILKEKIKQSKQKKMYVVRESSYKDTTYHGKTQYQYYCDTINDILHNIRSGGTDYCFNIFQIADLLKFEHDSLQVDWMENERCFLIALKNKME